MILCFYLRTIVIIWFKWPKIILNYRTNGGRQYGKTFEETIIRGRNRSVIACPVTDDDDTL